MGLLLFGIPAAIIAGVKGFKWIRWLLALGIVGCIVVICLPSAKTQGLSPEEATARAAKAGTVGAWLCGINLALSAIALVILFAMSGS